MTYRCISEWGQYCFTHGLLNIKQYLMEMLLIIKWYPLTTYLSCRLFIDHLVGPRRDELTHSSCIIRGNHRLVLHGSSWPLCRNYWYIYIYIYITTFICESSFRMIYTRAHDVPDHIFVIWLPLNVLINNFETDRSSKSVECILRGMRTTVARVSFDECWIS